MIKYKVRDVAKDLGVSVKEISDILEKNCGVTKGYGYSRGERT